MEYLTIKLLIVKHLIKAKLLIVENMVKESLVAKYLITVEWNGQSKIAKTK